VSTLHPAEHRLAAEPRSVRAARRVVSEAVGDALPEGELEGVLLATSEVVTNAVEHGAPPIDLRVDAADSRVRVEVRDGSPLPPRLRHGEAAGASEVRGRGMTIVDRVTDRWGIEERSDGKAVWFELDLRER
jgi:anti-sigma regulatory factor (Ser/Thr protein kinase)